MVFQLRDLLCLGSRKTKEEGAQELAAFKSRLGSKQQAFSQQVDSDILSIILSFFGIREKLSSLSLVSKTWFHFCWLSVTEFHIDAKATEEWASYAIENVLLNNNCYLGVKKLIFDAHGKTLEKKLIYESSNKRGATRRVLDFKNLQTLSLSTFLPTSGSLALLLAQMPNLTSLRINFLNTDVDDIKAIATLSKLKHLILEHAVANTTSPAAAVVPPATTGATVAPTTADTPMECLKYIAQKCTQLETLKIISSDAGAVLKHFHDSAVCNSLESLYIHYCTNMTAEHTLRYMTKYKKLKCLELYNTSNSAPGPLSDKGLAELFADEFVLEKLEKLSLAVHSFDPENTSDRAFELLANRLHNLKQLDLNLWAFKASNQAAPAPAPTAAPPVTATAILPPAPAVPAPPKPTLTEKGVLALSNLTQLEHLELSEVDKLTTEAQWQTLFGSMQKLKVLKIPGSKISQSALEGVFRTNPILCNTLEEISVEYCCDLTSLSWLHVPSSTATTSSAESSPTSHAVWKRLKVLDIDRLINLKDGLQYLAAAYLPKLEKLHMTKCLKVAPSELKYFSIMSPTVTTLDIHGLFKKDEDFVYLSKLQNLTALNLSHSQGITGAGFKYLFDEIKTTTSATPSASGSATSEPTVSIRYEPLLKNLKVVRLEWCKALTPEGLEMLANQTSLEKLYILTVKQLSGDSDAAVAAFGNKLKNLEILYIRDIEVTDSGLQSLSTLPRLKELLITNGRKITSAGLKAFSKMKALKSLQLNYNIIMEDKGVKQGMSPLKLTLEEVDLKRCKKITHDIQKYLPFTLIQLDQSKK